VRNDIAGRGIRLPHCWPEVKEVACQYRPFHRQVQLNGPVAPDAAATRPFGTFEKDDSLGGTYSTAQLLWRNSPKTSSVVARTCAVNCVGFARPSRHGCACWRFARAAPRGQGDSLIPVNYRIAGSSRTPAITRTARTNGPPRPARAPHTFFAFRLIDTQRALIILSPLCPNNYCSA